MIINPLFQVLVLESDLTLSLNECITRLFSNNEEGNISKRKGHKGRFCIFVNREQINWLTRKSKFMHLDNLNFTFK